LVISGLVELQLIIDIPIHKMKKFRTMLILVAAKVTAWRWPGEFNTLYTLNSEDCAQADCWA
jgi:hypothetical protein